MRRASFLLLFILMISALMGGTARAQQEAAIESVEVALWPEYDQPAMLGLYLVRLAADTPMPATVSLPLPDGVDEPHVVAAWFPDGALDDRVDWQVADRNGHRVVTTTVETTGVWIEFYAPLNSDGVERTYSFTWPGGLSVGAFDFEVMHPVGSSNLEVQPSGPESVGENGLTYSRLSLGRLTIEDTPEIELSYTKPDPLPTVWNVPASPTTPLALLEVALWPEFDRQATLVIYRAQLPPETQLPATVSLPIPIEAGEPHAVATIGDDRNLYVAPYEMDNVDEWSWVSVESDSLLLQIEYYAELTVAGDRRSFSYLWPGGVEINAFQYEIQRPPTASEILVTPAGVSQTGSDGLTYIRAGLGPKGADDPVAVSLAYEKSDAALSVDAVVSQPSLDRPATTQGGTPDLTELLPWLLGVFGVVLIGVAGYLLLRMRASQSRASKPRKRGRRGGAKKDQLENSPIYCHVCGSQASASDMFCRRCGTKLRQ